MTPEEKEALLKCLDGMQEANLCTLKILEEIAIGWEASVDDLRQQNFDSQELIERLRSLP